MCRKNISYRSLWRSRKRRSKNMFTYFRIGLLIGIMIFLAWYADGRIMPYLKEISEIKARNIITTNVTDVVNNVFANNVKYEDIVLVSKDVGGHVTSIQVNAAKMNLLSAKISGDMQERLSTLESQDIVLPLGSLLGNTIFSSYGPKIKIRIVPEGSVETDFRREFCEAGINQTSHRVFLDVTTSITIVAPFTERTTEVTTSLPIAETVIVGNVPENYNRKIR